MRCEQCEKIPLAEIHTPQEYMLCNTHTGGQIKINDKVFDPADYPDKKEDK